MQPGRTQVQFAAPAAGRALIAIVIVNVAAYVLQLMMLRAGVREVGLFYLRPSDVFNSGYLWQVVTYWWLHDPSNPSHLLFNMLMLWFFGGPLEARWGPRRFVLAYVIFGLGGSAMVLAVGLLSQTGVLTSFLAGSWDQPHLGASGAVLGMIIAWGLTNRDREFYFLFLIRMKGKTLVWIAVAFEMLTALSYAGVSSSSHFGGMIAGFVLVEGLWRPGRWKQLWRRQHLKAQQRSLEKELERLQQKKPPPTDPSQWN